MFGQIALSTRRLNRVASLSILPLMALAIVIGSRYSGANKATPPMPREGTLVIANLRSESLTFTDLGPGGRRDLALSGPPHELLLVAGRIYATLGRGDALIEVEPGAPGILRLLALDGEPHGLSLTNNDQLLVSLDKGNALVTVDRPTLAETARVATGETPHTVAFADGVTYVTASRDGRLQAFPAGLSAATGSMPESVAVVGRNVVTANVDGGTLTVFERDSLRVTRTISVGGRPVRVVALDDTHVLAALNGSARVILVNIATGKIERSVPTLGHPDGICLSPSGEYVAVASNEADAAQVFRRSDWALAGTIAAGDGPGSCLWLGRH